MHTGDAVRANLRHVVLAAWIAVFPGAQAAVASALFACEFEEKCIQEQCDDIEVIYLRLFGVAFGEGEEAFLALASGKLINGPVTDASSLNLFFPGGDIPELAVDDEWRSTMVTNMDLEAHADSATFTFPDRRAQVAKRLRIFYGQPPVRAEFAVTRNRLGLVQTSVTWAGTCKQETAF